MATRNASRSRSRPRPPAITHAYKGVRSRDELLESKMMSVKDFLRSMADYGPNGPMILHTRLKPIAILLRDGESRKRYEDNFRKWLDTRSVDVAALQDDPEEERRYRQCFAYTRAATEDFPRCDEERRSRSRPRSPSRGRKRSPSKASSRGLKRSRQEDGEVVQAVKPNSGREWEEKMAKRVAQLESDVSRRFLELEREDQKQPVETNALSSQEEGEIPNVVAKSESESPGKAGFFKEATEILKRATQTQAPPALKRLVKDYIRLNNQIVMNEAAVQDSLAYVKTLEGGADVGDHMRQIDELKASIDNEKRRRGTALAAVIAQEWKHKSEEFERLAGQVDLKAISHSSHEQLAGTYAELNRIGEEVLALQSKLKNRLSWVNGDGTGTSAQFEEVKELSKALSEIMSEWTKTERFRQGLSVDVARRDDAIYTLAKELIADAHLWLK